MAVSDFNYRHEEPCRTCGQPIYVSSVVEPLRFWDHVGGDADDGHRARPIPQPSFELTLRRGKTVVWSGKNAADAIYRYTSYRHRAKVVSWREVHYGESHKVGE